MQRVLFLIVLILHGWSAHGIAQERVKIAVSSRSIAFIDLYIAQDRGFFREEGLTAELIQVSANAATAALVSGEVDALGAVGLAARASQSGLPIKVLAVTGNRALFWLASRPEFKSIPALKGANLGITSRNGSQHLVANRLLSNGGLDPAKNVATVVIGGAPALLQALIAGSIQVRALFAADHHCRAGQVQNDCLGRHAKGFHQHPGRICGVGPKSSRQARTGAADDAGAHESLSLLP